STVRTPLAVLRARLTAERGCPPARRHGDRRDGDCRQSRCAQCVSLHGFPTAASYFRMRIEAVEQVAGKRRATLSKERQCVLEDVRGSALHGQILAVRTTHDTDQTARWSLYPTGALDCLTADAARVAATRNGGCRPRIGPSESLSTCGPQEWRARPSRRHAASRTR